MRRFSHFREKHSSIPLALLALAFALPIHAQDPGAKGSNAESRVGKKCDTLQRRIAKEESSLSSFEQTLATDRKGRETCSTKPMCARYDQAIKAMEARKSEHETRLAKFRSDAVEVCKSS
jgi:hypothetical protein